MFVAMALCALGAGTLATRGFRPPDRETDVGTAAAVGLALFLWVPYLFARPLGIEAGARAALALLVLLAAVGVCRLVMTDPWGGRRRGSAMRRWPLLVVALLTIVVGEFLYNASLRVRDGNLCSAGGGCEDMGLHATLAHAFLESHEQIVHPTYPIFHGWPLGYPFLADFSAAAGMALGASPGLAFFASAALALAAFMASAWAVARRWLPPASAALAVVLLLLGGNAGFVYFLRDLPSAGLAGTWLQDYVANFNLSLHYGNMATTVLVTMRTSLFGAPMAFAVVALLCRRGDPGLTDRVAVGTLLGSLPLVNGHAFLVTSLYLGGHLLWAPIRRLRQWWPALAIAIVLALPQLLWIRRHTGASATPFIRLANGFLFDTPLSWPVYWLLNGGVFVPLGIAAWAVARRSLRAAMLPLLLLLPLAMAVSFQPNPYDNLKLLLFFQLGCAIAIADLCRRSAAAGWGRSLAAAVALVLCTASGVLAWIREANIPCVMATPEDRAFGDLVLQQTDAGSVVLTGQHYTHPVPFLAGRTIILGFHNWLGQHGIPFAERAADVAAIYAGGAAAAALLEKYGVTHVVVGPIERREFQALDEATIAGLAAEHWTSGSYTLYRLRR